MIADLLKEGLEDEVMPTSCLSTQVTQMKRTRLSVDPLLALCFRSAQPASFCMTPRGLQLGWKLLDTVRAYADTCWPLTRHTRIVLK